MICLLESSVVDNSFSVPVAEGCGEDSSSIIDPILDGKLKLPSEDGHNHRLHGTEEVATAEAVEVSEKTQEEAEAKKKQEEAEAKKKQEEIEAKKKHWWGHWPHWQPADSDHSRWQKPEHTSSASRARSNEGAGNSFGPLVGVLPPGRNLQIRSDEVDLLVRFAGSSPLPASETD